MKKNSTRILLGIITLLLVGCIPDEATGVYEARNGNRISITEDGKVSWVSSSTDTSNALFLGILSVDKKTKEGHLVMQSTNRWIGTDLHFSADYKKVFLEWKRIDGGMIGNRATEYEQSK